MLLQARCHNLLFLFLETIFQHNTRWTRSTSFRICHHKFPSKSGSLEDINHFGWNLNDVDYNLTMAFFLKKMTSWQKKHLQSLEKDKLAFVVHLPWQIYHDCHVNSDKNIPCIYIYIYIQAQHWCSAWINASLTKKYSLSHTYAHPRETHTHPCQCLLSCLTWCARHSKTFVPRSSRCPSVSVTLRTPGHYGYLTNACSERTSASVSLKPSKYFMQGLCRDCYRECVDVSAWLWFECCPLCGRHTKSHQFFMFVAQS